MCIPLVWKITDTGLHYKESYTYQEWLGAGGIPEGRAINLFEANSKLSAPLLLFLAIQIRFWTLLLI